jgi:hypothetical protein
MFILSLYEVETMSNIVQRLLSNAVLFALLVSVSLSVSANNQSMKLNSHVTTSNLFAGDLPDQANLDIDVDTHVNVALVNGLQPLPTNDSSLYSHSVITLPFSQAFQRGPPNYLI